MKKLFLILPLATMFLGATAANVAKIGSTEYATIKAAFEAAVDGDTVVLISEVENNGAVFIKAPARKLVFDMAGFEWNLCGDETCDTQGFILEAGELTVIGNGEMVYNPMDGVGSALWFKTYKDTKLTLGEVAVTNIGSQPVVECHGELVIDGGVYNNHFFIHDEATKVTVNGGTLNQQLGLPDSAKVEFVMNGGKIQSLGDGGRGTDNTVVINDGEIIDMLSCQCVNTINGGKINKIMGGTVTIMGGQIDTLYLHTNNGSYKDFQIVYRAGTFELKGGIYATENFITDTPEEVVAISTKCAANYEWVANDDQETVADYPHKVQSIATAMEEINGVKSCGKVIRNGHLFIVKDGKEYTIIGSQL